MTRPTSKIIDPTNNKVALKAIKDERKKLAIQKAVAAAEVKRATTAITLVNKSIAKEIAALEKQRAAKVKAAQKALDAATKELERTATDIGKQFKSQLSAAGKELERALKVENKVSATTAKAAEKLDAKERKLTGAEQAATPTPTKAAVVKKTPVALASKTVTTPAKAAQPKAKQAPAKEAVATEEETNDEATAEADSDQFALF